MVKSVDEVYLDRVNDLERLFKNWAYGFVVVGVLCIPFWWFFSFWVWLCLSLMFGLFLGAVRNGLMVVGDVLRKR